MAGHRFDRLQAELGAQPLAASLLAQAPAGLLICDDGGHVFDLNPAASACLGVQTGALRGTELAACWSGGHVARWQQTRERLVRGLDKVSRLVLPLATVPGQPLPSRWVRLELKRECLPGSGDGYLFISLDDISAEHDDAAEHTRQREQVEQSRRVALSLMADSERDRRRAEEASKAKSTFLAMMSHEIRTPMNGVVGAVDLLAQDGLSAEQDKLVQIARESAHSLLRIINDVLDFSKIEAGQFDLEAVPYNWLALVDGVADLFALAVRQKRLRLICAVEPALAETWLLGDPVRLRQILVNLVGNAIKFTQTLPQRQGMVRVDVRTAAVDGSSQLEIRVADNGIGLSEAQRKALFQPFAQASASTHRRFGGTGLGLAICQRLTTLMGGQIECDGEVGQGSVFGVRLPLIDATDKSLPRLGSPWPDLGGQRVRLSVPEAALAEPLARALTHARAVLLQPGDGSPSDIELTHGPTGARQPATRRLRLRTDVSGKALADGDVEGNPLRPWAVCRDLALAAGRQPGADLTRADLGDLPGVPPPDTGLPPRGAAPRLLGIDEAAEAGRLVLVAEDNSVNREVLQRQLNHLGYTVLTVEDGAQALDQITQRPVALLLTDCQMPLVDGFELTRTLRRREAESAGMRLPIIGITAAAARGELERCLVAGMDDALTKPVALGRLSQALRQWLPMADSDDPPPAWRPPSRAKPPRSAAAPAVPPSDLPASGTTARNDTPDHRSPARQASSAPAAAAVLDLSALTRNLGPDPQIRLRVLEAFARATLDDSRAALDAARRRDPALAQKLAHKMVSSALTVGANDLARRCRELEALVRCGDLAGLGDATQALDDAARTAVAEVKALLKSA